MVGPYVESGGDGSSCPGRRCRTASGRARRSRSRSSSRGAPGGADTSRSTSSARASAGSRELGSEPVVVPILTACGSSSTSPRSRLPRTGIGNYTVGMLQGLVDAEAGTRSSRSRPSARAERGASARRWTGCRSSGGSCTLPPSSHTWRTGWSRLGRPAVERVVGRLDVFHFSDWMYPAQRSGVRATTVYDLSPLHHPEWVAPLTARMHGRKYEEAAKTCDVLFAISSYTAKDVTETLGLPPERVAIAHPGVTRASRRKGSGPISGRRTSCRSRRSSRGRTSRRSCRPSRSFARGGRSCSSWSPGAPVAWAEGGPGRRGRPRARLRARLGPPRPLPGRRRARLPVAARGLRDPGRRGDGQRDAGRRLVASLAGRRRRERRRASRPAEPGGARVCDRARHLGT